MAGKTLTVDNAAILKIARVYLRVSTNEQDLKRQETIIDQAKAEGFYIAGTYREKASGARADRPELLRMIDELQPRDTVIAERMDRISRLPLDEAEKLVAAIRAKGARLSVPGVVDLSELAETYKGSTRIVLEAVQDMLLKLALQMARDDFETRRERQKQGIELTRRNGKYAGRPVDTAKHDKIMVLRSSGHSIAETARLVDCSKSQVKRIWAIYRTAKADRVDHI